MPYASSGRICGGRQGLDGRLATLIGLYVREDSCIGSSFGRLVPLGSVGSPVVAMLSMQAVNAVLLQCSSSMHGGRVRCVEGSNHGDVCLVSGGPPVASKGIGREPYLATTSSTSPHITFGWLNSPDQRGRHSLPTGKVVLVLGLGHPQA